MASKKTVVQKKTVAKAAPTVETKVVKPEVKAEAPATTVKADEKKERKQRTGTKMEQALEIVKDNPGVARKQIIKIFMDKAKLTKAGASTYYGLVLKKLKTK